jgi:hypothetical protein
MEPLDSQVEIIEPLHLDNETTLDLKSPAIKELPQLPFVADREVSYTESEQSRDVSYITFGPKGGWYVLWNDNTSAWDSIPDLLSLKLRNRNKTLPRVISLSIDNDSNWVCIFADGSFATSGFVMPAPMKQSFFDGEGPSKFTFAPAGGWIMVYSDGTMAWERLPSGLNELLKRRSIYDSKLVNLSISQFGGWFARFEDGECEWEAIPTGLETILIQNIRKADPNLVVSLSPCDGSSYFVYIGDNAEWEFNSATLRKTLEYSAGVSEALPESVVWEVPATPSGSAENLTNLK